MSISYRATQTEPNLLSSATIHKFQMLSLLAIGVIIHLRWYGDKTIDQLVEHCSDFTSFAAISEALDSLIALGLVEEIIDAEVVGEVSA